MVVSVRALCAIRLHVEGLVEVIEELDHILAELLVRLSHKYLM